MKTWVVMLFIAALVGITVVGIGSSIGAADVEAGKAKASVCAGCHGLNGISGNIQWPNLAGQQEGYLINQIKAFRDGSRRDPLMSPMVKGLSDADIEDLAAYYHSLKSP